mgnify:CR=1 FL=1
MVSPAGRAASLFALLLLRALFRRFREPLRVGVGAVGVFAPLLGGVIDPDADGSGSHSVNLSGLVGWRGGDSGGAAAGAM